MTKRGRTRGAFRERQRLAAELEALETERRSAIERHRAEVARLTELSEDARRQVDRLTDERDRLSASLQEAEKLRQDAEEAEQAVPRLGDEFEFEQLTGERQAVTEARTATSTELASARRRIEELSQDLADSQQWVNQIRSMLKRLGIHLP